MAKPKRVRPTNHPIGQKINAVLVEKGLPGDYSALAKTFGVALTSVYGWVDKGRISKERLPALSEWSGRPLTWWLEPGSTVQTEEQSILATLKDWRMQASPRSQAVIDQLATLAHKGSLREDDWNLIDMLAARLRQKE